MDPIFASVIITAIITGFVTIIALVAIAFGATLIAARALGVLSKAPKKPLHRWRIHPTQIF